MSPDPQQTLFNSAQWERATLLLERAREEVGLPPETPPMEVLRHLCKVSAEQQEEQADAERPECVRCHNIIKVLGRQGPLDIDKQVPAYYMCLPCSMLIFIADSVKEADRNSIALTKQLRAIFEKYESYNGTVNEEELEKWMLEVKIAFVDYARTMVAFVEDSAEVRYRTEIAQAWQTFQDAMVQHGESSSITAQAQARFLSLLFG